MRAQGLQHHLHQLPAPGEGDPHCSRGPGVLVPDILVPGLLMGPDSRGTQPLRVHRTVSFTGPSHGSLGPGMREEPPARPKRARLSETQRRGVENVNKT